MLKHSLSVNDLVTGRFPTKICATNVLGILLLVRNGEKVLTVWDVMSVLAETLNFPDITHISDKIY